MHNVGRIIEAVKKHFMTGIAVVALSGVTVSALAMQAAAKSTNKPKASKLDIMLMKPTAATTGDNQFEVMVKGADGKPISDADVSVLLVMPAMPAMKMPEMRNEVKLTSAGGGTYTGTGQVTMAGKWNATVRVRQNGKEIGQKKVTVTAK